MEIIHAMMNSFAPMYGRRGRGESVFSTSRQLIFSLSFVRESSLVPSLELEGAECSARSNMGALNSRPAAVQKAGILNLNDGGWRLIYERYDLIWPIMVTIFE